MEENEQQQTAARTPAGEPAKESAKESAKGRRPNWAALIVGGDLLQSRVVLKQTKLILLIILYGLGLVFCRYRVEGLSKEKLAAQERINYLRESRIELQKRFQETVKISQIAEMLDSTGVGITAGPPYEI